MQTDPPLPDWIITRVDGKISSVSTNYSSLLRVAAKIASRPASEVGEVHTEKISTPELFDLSERTSWDDLRPFGSPFQISVWKELFSLSHTPGKQPALMSYSALASAIGKETAVRAVAHAVGQNPINVIIPCHLVIPKESFEKISDLVEKENGLFRWKALYVVDSKIDFGEYSLGAKLKKRLAEIQLDR